MYPRYHWEFRGTPAPQVSPGLGEGSGKACQAHWAFFPTAAAVRSRPALGCWRRWRQQAQGPPLFQYHPVEQTRGVRGGRLGHGSGWTSLDLLSPLPACLSSELGRRQQGSWPSCSVPALCHSGHHRNHRHCPEGPGRPPFLVTAEGEVQGDLTQPGSSDPSTHPPSSHPSDDLCTDRTTGCLPRHQLSAADRLQSGRQGFVTHWCHVLHLGHLRRLLSGYGSIGSADPNQGCPACSSKPSN